MLASGVHERRAHLRICLKFSARISKPGWFRPVEGATENISQRGAFVRTEDWHAFGVKDQAVVTILLPPSFSGQVKTVGLQGNAVVTRVDQQKGGVALRFDRDFSTFEPLKALCSLRVTVLH
jgi:hypothetical protein